MLEAKNIGPSPKTIYRSDYQEPAYFIDEIDLCFDLSEAHTLVTSHLRVRHNRHSKDKQKNLQLDGEALNLISIHLDGKELATEQYQVNNAGLIILNVPDNFDLNIVVKIFPQNNTALSGLYRSKNTYCTQCEAEGFRRITFFPDHPDILARYTTKIIADKKHFPILLSNGNLIESGELEGDRHFVVWEDPFKKPSYLFALVAGDFDILEDQYTTQSERDISIRIYVEKGYGDQAQHALISLKEAMRWDEKAYGREYDLDVYMIVAISDFNMGAMENKGLNIFNTKYVLAKPETATDDDYIHILSVVGHEYFHNWSGNRVTCRDWFQLSLKEGLTIFRDQSFTEDLLSPGVMRIHEVTQLREAQFPEDASPLAHPVRPESYIEINNFYTATVYNKGAEVLRMLQTILGKSLFRKGMDLYFARHDGQAVTIEDFVKTMEDVSGLNLTQFRLWYSQAGTPVVSVQEDYNAQKQTYTLMMSQTCPPTPSQPEKLPMHIPIKIGLIAESGLPLPLHFDNEKVADEKVLHLTEASQLFQFTQVASRPIPSLLRNFSAPIKLNFQYSEKDLQFLIKHDVDAFNRWEACQKYLLRIILGLIQDYQSGKNLQLPAGVIDLLQYLLQQHTDDPFLLAELLLLPSEKYIGEQMQVVDVVAIHAVREFLIREIADKLHAGFLSLYETLQESTNASAVFKFAHVGKNHLKNRCLSYLTYIPHYLELSLRQFEESLQNNMTDTQAALVALANLDKPERSVALDKFYETWQSDALVLDKWFAIQAATKLPIALQEVKKLLRHEAFDIKNPNKVYALIGTFGYRNPINFHASDGEGYAFLRDTVQQLDALNPQVAARMVKPLTTWRRYDKERQRLMQQQLTIMLQNNKISNDLYEIVNKSLEATNE